MATAAEPTPATTVNVDPLAHYPTECPTDTPVHLPCGEDPMSPEDGGDASSEQSEDEMSVDDSGSCEHQDDDSARGASPPRRKPGPVWLHDALLFLTNYTKIRDQASPAMRPLIQEKMNNVLKMMLAEQKLADSKYELAKEELKHSNDLDGVFKDLADCQYMVPEWSCPINADVTTFNFRKLARWSKFDAIVMDPPWQLSSANPTRGVAISYQQLSDNDLKNMHIECLSSDGIILIWTINAKYSFTLDLLEQWGYEYVDQIQWVKRANRSRRIAKGHGFYLQHAKETLVIGRKGSPKVSNVSIGDCVFARRTGQSCKPPEVYEIVESLIPNGKYLEVFGRMNNLRNYWVTVGNELGGAME